MAPIMTPFTIADYTILPIQIPSAVSYPVGATHYIYLRPHDPKIPDPDSPRSLFLVNVPFDSTDAHFRSLFADQLNGGRCERVEFETARPARKAAAKLMLGSKSKKRKRQDVDADELVPRLPEIWDRELHASGSTAVVVFVDRPSMELSLKVAKRAAKAKTELVWGKEVGDRVPKMGSQRYLAHQSLRYPQKEDLQTAVDSYMTTFAAVEAARSRKLARLRQIPDEEGFITVTRGGRAGPARIEEAQEKIEELKKKEDAKREGMSNFYRFQVRERKKQMAGELVKRFEDDRRKVEEMRQQRGRRFRPH